MVFRRFAYSGWASSETRAIASLRYCLRSRFRRSWLDNFKRTRDYLGQHDEPNGHIHYLTEDDSLIANYGVQGDLRSWILPSLTKFGEAKAREQNKSLEKKGIQLALTQIEIRWSEPHSEFRRVQNPKGHLDSLARSMVWSDNEGPVLLLDDGRNISTPSFKPVLFNGEDSTQHSPIRHKSPPANDRPRLLIHWLYREVPLTARGP